jgi:hypothetical protein
VVQVLAVNPGHTPTSKPENVEPRP